MTSKTARTPDFAIIGAQKSASTFVQHVLQSHPQIFLTDGEIAAFEEPQYSDFDFDTFLSLFEGGRAADTVGLKRPNYLHEPDVPPRPRNTFPTFG